MSDVFRSSVRWPRAIVCDLDGTLIDSAPDVAMAANRALAGYGVSIDAAQTRLWLGDGARIFIDRVLAHHGIATTDNDAERATTAFSTAYADNPCQDTRAFAGARNALERLRSGGLRIAVCTNKPEAIARLVLDRTSLAPLVDVLVGGGNRLPLKPAPDSLHACLDILGITAAQALYIGDMSVDIEAARAADIAVLVASFGYAQTPAEALGADATFDDWFAVETAIQTLQPEAPRHGD